MKELVISAHGFNSLSSFLSCEYGETEQFLEDGKRLRREDRSLFMSC